MHDIDRTQLEASWETGDFEAGEYEFETASADGSPFSEMEEMELASQLLEVSDEAELDQFLGSLFKKASRAVGSFLKGPIGKQLGGMIKPLVKKALPMVGGALGSFIPIPGVGTAVGTALGSAASNMFEMELEGMSAEDQEFEVARRVVRLAGEAAQQAAQTPPAVPPQEAAKAALVSAAQQHAPGLLRQPAPPTGTGQYSRQGRSGRWARRGRTIVLYGL
jgi:uncharacterized protein (DUF697 family)